MTDKTIVGCAFAVIAALLIGCASGIAIGRTGQPVARVTCMDSADGVHWRPAPCMTSGWQRH